MASTDKWARVHTTLPHPLPSSAARKPTLTPRLLIRPLAATDLAELHVLMTQPEVMQWTAAGRAHTSIAETERKLAQFLPPAGDLATFNCAICLRSGEGEGEGRSDTGELVGIGGVHRFSRTEGLHGVDPEGGYGWPELGYLFKREFWGRGLATEFVSAFLGMWDGLQREHIEVKVNAKSLISHIDDAEDETMAREELVAVIDPSNGASGRILEKCGFGRFDEFTERHREDSDKSLKLVAFRYFPRIAEQAKQTE
ncbi:unnamed protein product [Discula destructiva]